MNGAGSFGTHTPAAEIDTERIESASNHHRN
jgi:hypothetical protein